MLTSDMFEIKHCVGCGNTLDPRKDTGVVCNGCFQAGKIDTNGQNGPHSSVKVKYCNTCGLPWRPAGGDTSIDCYICK